MAIDRGDLDRQLRNLGDAALWWDQRELRDLPSVLEPDEQVLALARGRIGRVRWARRKWLIVITDVRLVCLRSAGRTWRQAEVLASDIDRVGLRIGPRKGRVIIVAGSQKWRLLVPRTDAYKLASALSQIAGTKTSQPSLRPTVLVRRVLDHVLALPAVAFQPESPPPPPPLPPARPAPDPNVEQLEQRVQDLQQQVRFLEQLLQQRQGAVVPDDDG